MWKRPTTGFWRKPTPEEIGISGYAGNGMGPELTWGQTIVVGSLMLGAVYVGLKVLTKKDEPKGPEAPQMQPQPPRPTPTAPQRVNTRGNYG